MLVCLKLENQVNRICGDGKNKIVLLGKVKITKTSFNCVCHWVKTLEENLEGSRLGDLLGEVPPPLQVTLTNRKSGQSCTLSLFI